MECSQGFWDRFESRWNGEPEPLPGPDGESVASDGEADADDKRSSSQSVSGSQPTQADTSRVPAGR